jgi:hypothetical protein
MSAYLPLLGAKRTSLAVGCDSTQCVSHSLADALAVAFLSFGLQTESNQEVYLAAT